jgi:Flp pilus assembly pilin Flp
MKRFINALSKFARREHGPTMTEYAIMAALVAVACIVVTKALGQEISVVFSTVSSTLAGVV